MKKGIQLTLLFLLVNVATLFAQGDTPCGGADPDAVACPVDSWVIGFAATALIITTLHLRNKKAPQADLSNNQ